MLRSRGLFVSLASLIALAAPPACARGPSGAALEPNAGGSDDGGQSGAAASAGQTGGAFGAAGDASGASSGAGGDDSDRAGAAGQGGAGDAGAGGSAPACEVETAEHELVFPEHVDTCSVILYATNPPSSGPHYPIWAAFGVYDFALPRGFWVHNLEHGAVVVSYNCPDGCAGEVAEASAWLASLSSDASCPAGPPRVLLVPDPELDVRWGASAWGFNLRAACFDAAAFSEFYAAHAGQLTAPEYAVCAPGSDLRAPGADTCGAN